MISTKRLPLSKHTLLLLFFTLLLILLVPRLLPLLHHPHLPSHTATKGQGPRTKDHSHLPSHKETKDNGFGEWLLEQERRRTRIAKFCANKVKQQNFDRLHFHLNKEHNLLFCFQPKVRFSNLMSNMLVTSQVGSTTWLNHFISLEKRDVQEKLASLERFEKVKYLAPTDLDLVSLAKASISITMVRHFFWASLILVFR